MKIPVLLFALVAMPLAGAHGQALGTIKATTRLLPDGTTMTSIVNPDTRTKEETHAEKSGKVLKKTIYTLNEQDFATSAAHLDAKGAVRYREFFTFDYTGRITESKLFAADNRPLGRRVFIYDGKVQNQARIEDYDAAGNRIAQAARPGTARTAQPEVRRAIPVR